MLAASCWKPTICSLSREWGGISKDTAKHAMLRSSASLECSTESMSSLLIHLTMNAVSISFLSFMLVDNSRWCLVCDPVLPRILPTKTSSSVRGWCGCSLYSIIMHLIHWSYLLHKNCQLEGAFNWRDQDYCNLLVSEIACPLDLMFPLNKLALLLNICPHAFN